MASNVPALFAASLAIDQRKDAEAQLSQLAVQKGFLPHLLQIVLDRTHPTQIRQAACVYFKNQIKLRWDDVSAPSFSNIISGPARPDNMRHRAHFDAFPVLSLL